MNTSFRVVDLAPELRQAAEVLLGRPLEEDETLRVSSFRGTQTAEPAKQLQWEADMEQLIEAFSQHPPLPDEALSRESIYSREDEIL